jgi:phosphoribosyl-ATP pyrophosphohydrolase
MADLTDHRLAVLAELAEVVARRRGADPDTSYTARLLAAGVEKCAKKLGEEAVETALAAVKGDKAQIAAEAADLLYHLLVTLAATGVPLAQVMTALDRRMGRSGVEEKAGRKSI